MQGEHSPTTGGTFPTFTPLMQLSVPRTGLVVGPPGSGKTMTAVHYAVQVAPTTEVLFLVASRHLVSWVEKWIDTPAVTVKTWREWLSETYRETTGESVPIQERHGSVYVDWEKLSHGLEKFEPDKIGQVLVDEAQDVPQALFALLARCSEHILAFADPFQRHAFDGSTVDDVLGELNSSDPWPVYVLEEDFRTTREIQKFAAEAWVPQRAYPARVSQKSGAWPRVIEGDVDVIASLLSARRQSDSGSVAVAAAHADRAAIIACLRGHDIPVNRGGENSDQKVSVLAFEALRGLEFENVIVIPPYAMNNGWKALSADLYVACTRARSSLTVVLIHEPFSQLAAALTRVKEPEVNRG